MLIPQALRPPQTPSSCKNIRTAPLQSLSYSSQQELPSWLHVSGGKAPCAGSKHSRASRTKANDQASSLNGTLWKCMAGPAATVVHLCPPPPARQQVNACCLVAKCPAVLRHAPGQFPTQGSAGTALCDGGSELIWYGMDRAMSPIDHTSPES